MAAVATSNAASGPGSAVSTALWRLNLGDLTFKPLAAATGVEQVPVAWSPDGRYVLVQSTIAQGRCSYSYVDAVSGDAHPVNKDITYCGTNGEVLGWTALR